MEFYRRAAGSPARLGVFPGTFNPITVAHVALARTALDTLHEVVFVLPRRFPHKDYRDTSLEQRVELLGTALAAEPRFSIAAAEGGLFIEIARECRAVYGDHVRLSFLCGRDAAERIANWDYGRPEAWQDMLREFELLVAPRGGEYCPDPAHSGAVRGMPLEPGCEGVSSSEVRRRIRTGEAWEHLVPTQIQDAVRKLYTGEAID
ncbi:MAG: adenylyltransferase/cytidyltransferase family protein [Acidobacteria bacterium]|nr:adenylyltransferase/cytidyltransferase family protein [Acidobacteriota bacterium]